LALPELEVPDLVLEELGPDRFRVTCRFQAAGAGRVIAGILTAMADDYGALVLIEHQGTTAAGDVIAVTVLDARHASGRSFDLAMPGVR
jgi:hypothetical protein